MTQKSTPKKIPHFASEAEAAAFWDTHSPLDFPEDFQETPVSFSRPLVTRGLTIKLSDETLGELKSIAHQKGIGPSTLVRMWIVERLRATKRVAP